MLRATVLGLFLGAVVGCLVCMGAVAKFGPARDDSVPAYVATGVGCSMALMLAARYLLEVARNLRATRPRFSSVLTGVAWVGYFAFWVRAVSFYSAHGAATDHGAFEGLWLGLAEGVPGGALLGAALGFTLSADMKPRVAKSAEELA